MVAMSKKYERRYLLLVFIFLLLLLFWLTSSIVLFVIRPIPVTSRLGLAEGLSRAFGRGHAVRGVNPIHVDHRIPFSRAYGQYAC